ncbi:MAG: hypothetical protein JJE02_03990 [Propionibacteriales bacterium]|nr:hypothetical protein [Propionibacteriales bacterium]
MKLHRSGPWIGVTGVTVMLWLTVASVVFAPWWGVLIYLVPWAISVWFVAKLARTNPKRAAYVPLGGFAAWLLVSAVGAQFWGWGS